MDNDLMKGYKEEICLFTWTHRLSYLVLEGGGVQLPKESKIITSMPLKTNDYEKIS